MPVLVCIVATVLRIHSGLTSVARFRMSASSSASVISLCPRCGQSFRNRRGWEYCCGHCQGNRGHGKHCHRRIVLPCRRLRSRSPRQFSRRDLGGRTAVPVRTLQPRDVNVNAPSVANNASLPLRLRCAVCLDRERTHSCIPCGHRALCEHCATPENLARLNNTCPVCRADILLAVQIHL